MRNLLPLDTWRAFLGLPPWHFWGWADTGPGAIVPIVSKCSTLVYEYDWQGSDAAGRSSIREAIVEAERMLRDYLGYRVAPEYVDYALVDWPRYHEIGQTRYSNADVTGRRIAVQAPEGYLQLMGVEQLTLIGTVAIVYTAQFNSSLQDTFSVSIATTETDTSKIAVYFTTVDRPDGDAVSSRWRVEPVTVTISGGIATITGRAWLLARPILYENPTIGPLDPNDAANFASALDVYIRTTDQNGNSVTTAQATLVYETSDCGACWGSCCCGASGTASSDPGTTGEVIARAGIRDKELGLVTPGASVYDPSSGLWSSAGCCSAFCEPDRVKLRYLAGKPLVNGQMDRKYVQIVARLSAAELKRRICACRETNEMLHDLQQDLTLQSTQSEQYSVSQEDLTNPFGTRRGHVQAWRAVRYDILRRGIST